MLEWGKAMKLMFAGLTDYLPNLASSVSGVEVLPAVCMTDLDCKYSIEASIVVANYWGVLPAETH